MESVNLNVDNQYFNAFQAEKIEANKDNNKTSMDNSEETLARKIHNSAVSVSISMESIKVYLNIKSAEITAENTNAQSSLMNIINNSSVYDFLAGREIDQGFSLKSIGYEGKPITELTPDEAKNLVSNDGFFGIEQTSSRVSSFVFSLAGDDVESLKEARKGIVQGFKEAEQMWGGKLPDISYETQDKTLSIIDEKIAELTKTDSEKELENPEENTQE
jgi:hypothetical protein